MDALTESIPDMPRVRTTASLPSEAHALQETRLGDNDQATLPVQPKSSTSFRFPSSGHAKTFSMSSPIDAVISMVSYYSTIIVWTPYTNGYTIFVQKMLTYTTEVNADYINSPAFEKFVERRSQSSGEYVTSKAETSAEDKAVSIREQEKSDLNDMSGKKRKKSAR